MSTPVSVRVKHINKDTPDSVVLVLDIPANQREKFAFRAGQYLTFVKDFDGEELRRSYSICVGEGCDEMCVGIKKVENGAFSSFANDQLQVGDVLAVMPPQGRFTLESHKANRVLLIAAGSGITPILSHAETILTSNSEAHIALIYGNKSPRSVMFRERLEELKNQYLKRFSVMHVFSRTAQDIELFSGRIDGERCKNILHGWCHGVNFDKVFICGPEKMIKDVRSSLEDMGVERRNIRYELFGTAARKKTIPAQARQGDAKKALTVVIDGASYQLELLAGEPVLDAARRQHIDAPFSCRSGICSTCRCKILKGSGHMEMNHALEDYEVEQGYALSCQLTADSDAIVISYDEGH